jgi:hypothetical protein
MRTTAAATTTILLLLLGHAAAGPARTRGPRGWIEREGTTACWSAGAHWARGCEISGALWSPGRGLVVVTDKTLASAPGRSQVWRTCLPRPGAASPRLEEYVAPAFLDAVKFEGMAAAPCDGLGFATTSFSWFVKDDPRRDPWNVLVAWPLGCPQRAQVVERTARDGHVGSIGLIPRMRRALASAAEPRGPAWFKIEGLAVLPGHRLAFGVRALGASHEAGRHRMVAIVLAVRYAVCGGCVRLVGPFRKILDWDAGAVIGKPVGLSGLVTDGQARRLMILTSYEKEPSKAAKDHGGWCWVLPLCALGRPGCVPRVVRDREGAPLDLRHKAEAIVKVGPCRYLVLHDDDDVLGTEVRPPRHAWPRKPEEAAFTYLHVGR